MALIHCPECGDRTSDSALQCPHCGYAVREHVGRLSQVAGGTTFVARWKAAPWWQRIAAGLGVLMVLLSVPVSEPSSAPQTYSAAPSASAIRPARGAAATTGLLTEAQLGSENWPFFVSQVRVTCHAGAVTAEIGGTEYAVNGTAKSRGYPDIEPHWRFDTESGYGLRVSIGPIIEYGLSLCNMR
jgi:hypothetical protein